MSEKKKKPIKLIEEKLETFENTKWAKSLRITSGVVWNLFLLFIIFGLTLAVFAGSLGAGYFASLVSKEPLRSKEQMRNAIFSYEETSEIYLADGIYHGKVNADIERKETKLKDVSPYVIDAVLATEDEYFKTHNGVVPKAVFRGLFQDVTNSDSQTGGSTLTQQLIKNQILTNEVSYERKAKEILLAMRMEHFMDKDEILEAYLNIIPYGRNSSGDPIAGIETAAEGIFNLHAKELNLPQAAYIAGLPQGPSLYTPYYSGKKGLKGPEQLKPGIDRMKTVLFRMKETGYISDKQYNEAIVYDITKDFRKPTLRANERYPYLTQEIQNQTEEILAKILAEKDGIDLDRLVNEKKVREKYSILAKRSMQNDGYRIYSTIDKSLYDAHNEIAKNFEHYGHTYTIESKNSDTGEVELLDDPVQVGSILIENSTGKILSFIGGRDHSLVQVNHATQAYRQNGSSMKPLLVYAPAIEYGLLGAGSPVVDVKFEIPDPGDSSKIWSPGNYNASQELGIIPARQALATSQNLAAARLYRDIIDRRPADFLKKMNFSKLDPEDFTNYSTSYGGMKYGTSVEENTNAYATFANGGKFIPSYMIEKIEDMEGNIIYENIVEPVDVFSPETAYIITDMLRDVPKHGTATTMNKNLNFNIDIAAKTGTTNNYGNVWLVGYNPNVSLGVWLGYKHSTRGLHEFKNKYLHPSTRTNLLFARLMNATNEVRPELVGSGAKFKQPEGVVSESFCGISGLAPSAACSDAGLVSTDLFNSKTFLPTELDDSLVSSSYVYVKGTRYRALPSTPLEFISDGGTGVSEEFIERMLGPWKGDASKLFPANSAFASTVVSGATFEADEFRPEPVLVSLTDTTITWDDSLSDDIVGYYLYEMHDGDSMRIASIGDDAVNSYKISPGSYFVRAVDITGQLSDPSNIVTIEVAALSPVIETPENPPPGGGKVPSPGSYPPLDDDEEDDGNTHPPGNEDGEE